MTDADDPTISGPSFGGSTDATTGVGGSMGSGGFAGAVAADAIRSGGVFSSEISFKGTMMTFAQPRGICLKHGDVEGGFRCSVAVEPEYTTGPICPKCYVDWIAANVSAVKVVEPQ